MNFLIKLLIFSNLIFSSSQTGWMKNYGGNGMDEAYYVEVISDGTYLITGSTESYGYGKISEYKYSGEIIDCPTPKQDFWKSGTRDIWLLKVDINGNKIWDKTYGSSLDERAYSVKETKEGDYIVLGSQYNKKTKSDIYLIKVNKYGEEIWTKIFGGVENDLSYYANQTLDGGYAIIGITGSYGKGENDLWFIKLDKNGNKLFDKTYGLDLDDFGYHFTENSNGEFLIVGGSTSMQKRTYKDKVYNDKKLKSWILKINTNGELIWDKKIGEGVAQLIKKTNTGDYLIRTTLPSQGNPNQHLRLSLINEDGELIWDKFFNDVLGVYGGNSIEQARDSTFVVISHTYGYRDLSDYGDLRLIKVNNKGNIVWEKLYKGKDGGIDQGNSIKLTPDNGFILVGNIDIKGKKIEIEMEINDEYDEPPFPGQNQKETFIDIIYPFIKNLWIIKTDSLGNIKNKI